MPIWQLCANLLIPNCLRSNLSYSPLAALELYVKNPESKYYGKNLTHDAVIWTEETFWNKLLRFLHRRKYAKFINFSEFMVFMKRGEIRKILAYKNSTDNVKCIRCNGNAELWNPSKGCPICANVLEKQDNYMFFTD